MKLEFEVPLRIRSVANLREHWATKARRVRAERDAIALRMRVWAKLAPRTTRALSDGLSVVVTLIRVAPRKIRDTHDNLRSGFKAVADEVAAQLGIDDGDPRITWRYEQEKGDYAVRVCIETAEAEAA